LFNRSEQAAPDPQSADLRSPLPGDVLSDEWEKYCQLWIDAGGRLITHMRAGETDRVG
jgi:hypothetical protein